MIKILNLSIAALSVLLLSACGDGTDTTASTGSQGSESSTDNTIHKLAPQNTQGELFYGNSLHAGLGGLSSVTVIGKDTQKLASKSTIDVRYPVVTTTLTYEGNDGYSNLSVQTLSYVSEGTAYKVSMSDGSEVANSSSTNLTAPGYSMINYLGSKQYLMDESESGKSILITPEMSSGDSAIALNDKTLLTLSYSSYGEAANGYIVYDSNKTTLQNCSMDMQTCTDISGIDSAPKLLGDIGGTINSVLYVDHKLYLLDKSTSSISEIGAGKVTPRRASSIPYTLSGDELFYLENGNIFRVDLDGTVEKIYAVTNDHPAERIRGWTDDMVIFASGNNMYAANKDGSIVDAAIEISVTTKTKGQKYPYDLGIGKQYLYNLYSIDTQTGKNTFSACKLEDGKKECRDDAYWSSVTAAQSGTLNYSSGFKYTPYAYIRVDTTDNYGGGNVKAIDPKHPLADGITMGSIENYNFQTFVNSRNDIVDSEGNIVLYAKNDLNFRGDAFMMNLTKENSLVNLTNEPDPDITLINSKDGGHCHGRKCSECHSFAGGKIYNKEGKSAKGYSIRFEFEDGSESILAKIRKGEGENFNTPLESLVGKNFNAVVVDENGTTAAKSFGYNHKGIGFFNCNYCHSSSGVALGLSPNIITAK